MNVVKSSKMQDGAEVSSRMSIYVSMFEADILFEILSWTRQEDCKQKTVFELLGTLTENQQIQLFRMYNSLLRSI